MFNRFESPISCGIRTRLEVNKPFGVPCSLQGSVCILWHIYAVISNGRPSLSAVRCVVPPLAVSHQSSPSRGTGAMSANTGSRILASFICIHVRLVVYEEFYGLL